MQLPFSQRLKLLRQQAYAALRLGGHKAVRVAPASCGAVITVENQQIFAPSALRWKLYRHGWRARLDLLEREYGIGRYMTLTPQSVVLDVGANAGEFAHVCDRYGARVHCFEPDPAVYACLMQNIAALDRASAYDDVLWKEIGEIDFGLAPARADSSVFSEGVPTVRKKATTIESFCSDHEIAQIDLIKCDAEGAEPEVLKGIGDFFPNVHTVALDTGAERHGERTHDRCAAILSANGFDVIEERVGTRWMTYGINQN
ncbi:MAG: FkbM family methyltransferase [Pseudomonadota bacterium]